MTDRELQDYLLHFPVMPAEAIVPRRAAALLLGLSPETLARHPRMQAVEISRNRKGYRVEDIRKALGSKQS